MCSTYQTAVLPMVTVKPTPGQRGLDGYLAANNELITKLNMEVYALSKEYIAFTRLETRRG